MPFRRTIGTECLISAPPPSPIPTAKGSRSAANDSLSSYLDNSLNIPDLSLPQPPPQPRLPIRSIPLQIDYYSLENGDYATVELLLRSAREFGAFRIACRGIFVDDLLTFANESDRVFNTDIGNQGSFDQDGKDQIIWSLSSGMGGMKKRLMGKHRQFSEKMEIIERKLDMIGELLGKIFVENIARMEFGERLLGKESILSIYRYNEKYKIGGGDPFSSSNDQNTKKCDYTWCLHLPATPSQFYVRSETDLLSFQGSPDTIVVIVGQRIEEWSMGDFKCVCKQVIGEPQAQAQVQRSQASFCLEFKCLSLNFEPPEFCNHFHKTISLRDQILIMLLLYFLYKIFLFLYL
ncbi:uncharacterized protein [Euphorbia lathyris]|uniref:uncharacterized protein n=1 Tax=Euphorbia lathyris TaxID=212925 RepID=UPI0033130E79